MAFGRPNPRAPMVSVAPWVSAGWLVEQGRAGRHQAGRGRRGEVTGSARSCVICVHAYLFPGGFFVNKPEIAFAALRYSPRQYTVLSLL